MTTIYKCQYCDHESDVLDEIDIVDWANEQDPADVVGIPSGCCTKCYAPVYEPGTFDKIDAASALLTSLIAMCEPYGNMPAEYFTSPRPREVIIAARAAITQARAAGITPTP